MSYTQTTEFYEIPLPQETDLVNPMDDNDAKERIDTDLHSAVQNASSAVETAGAASDAAAAAVAGLEELSGTVNTEKGKLTALTARVTAAENEIDDVRADDQDAICAFNEPTATSTHAYAIGDYFFYNNVLYRATAAIAIGDTIVPNTNCEARNITADLIEIMSDLSNVETSLSGKQKAFTVDTFTGTTDAFGNINVPTTMVKPSTGILIGASVANAFVEYDSNVTYDTFILRVRNNDETMTNVATESVTVQVVYVVSD